MKSVLVTGGAGYIGSHTVVELHNAGYRPIIIDNFSNSNKSSIEGLEKIIGKSVILYEGDYQDTAYLNKIVESESVECLIHFAAYKAVGESVQNPLKYYGNNVSGFIKLLAFCEESKIKNIVFSSSCTVYGEPDRMPVGEDSPFKPAESPYGSTKQMCEIILKDSTEVSKNFNSIALRYFNPIGAHPSAYIGELPLGMPANLVPFVTQTAAGIRKELIVFGDDYNTVDGTCIRDYIHVVDLAKAHVKALEYLELKESGITDNINIGTGKGSSVLEVINTFKDISGVDLPYKIGPRRIGDIVSTYASTDKSRDLLDWKPDKNLAEALADAWRWQLKLK